MAYRTVSKSHTVTITAPSQVKAGDVFVLGSLVGVAISNAEPGEPVAIKRNIIALLNKGNTAFVLGQKVYWNAANQQATDTSTGGGVLIGTSTGTFYASVPRVQVLLKPPHPEVVTRAIEEEPPKPKTVRAKK